MDIRVNKLAYFVDRELAEKMVAAGYDSPKAIKTATDADLLAIKGIGSATVTALRKRLKKR